jgi:hypothetical protein
MIPLLSKTIPVPLNLPLKTLYISNLGSTFLKSYILGLKQAVKNRKNTDKNKNFT